MTMPTTSTPPLPDAVLAQVASWFRLLGEPFRLRLLRELMAGETSVNDLADACGSGQANVSKHLGLLRAEGLVDFRREGNRKLYRISDPVLPQLCHLVCGALEERLATHLGALRGGRTRSARR